MTGDASIGETRAALHSLHDFVWPRQRRRLLHQKQRQLRPHGPLHSYVIMNALKKAASLTASAVFAYFLGLFFRSHLIELESHAFIAAVTVACATVLLLVLWNGRTVTTSTSSTPLQPKLNEQLPSANKPSSSGCCGGACSDGNKPSSSGCCGGVGPASQSGACCQDNSDSASIASSVGSHKGMSKDAFHKWKRDNPEEYRNLKAERRKEIKAREAAVRLARRKSRGATIPEDADAHGREPPRLLILYGTQTGNARSFAMEMFEEASERGFFATCLDMEKCTPHVLLENEVVFAICSTHIGGAPPPGAVPFFDALFDQSVPLSLKDVRFSVLGLGHAEYEENYCKVIPPRPPPAAACGKVHTAQAPKELDARLEALGGQRLAPIFLDDFGLFKEGFNRWKPIAWDNTAMSFGMVVFGAGGGSDESSGDEEEGGSQGSAVDIEDMGSVIEEDSASARPNAPPRKMVTEGLRKSLTKQGYRIVGTHSGVKLCRWTKSMLRGRGGCYKHTFYGISSYQCMESTPSLACANKCVFCWRHHKNPVGTEWRWQTDDPEHLVSGFMNNHKDLIKTMRGLPGVLPERLQEAERIRHCALSLVGEPIIYPHINRFLGLLHENGISSFLVTNAQFPDKMETLIPVTQLYISVDAANKTSLQAVDRPLFKDFWERFLSCIDVLKAKGQRTVFRMTLVKQLNMDEVLEYVELVQRGTPDFIEIKGVTFCGGSRSELSMSNVPWHEEVLLFGNQMLAHLDSYELASEHAHSCCILLAHKKFKIGGQWHTHIDFDKFLVLAKCGQPFSSMDYLAPTPEWAVYGRGIPGDGGFDPSEFHYRRGAAAKARGGGC